jgi:hypothetical protein
VCCTICNEADVALTIVRELDGPFVEIDKAECDCGKYVRNKDAYLSDLYAAILE